jgi:ubiquinone/menaquinone biosynthesis C-methylase UbiE
MFLSKMKPAFFNPLLLHLELKGPIQMNLNKEISPSLYQWMVRPNWITKKYIHDRLRKRFRFDHHTVLDFGSGTGANCTLFPPERYKGIDPDEKRVSYSRKRYKNHRFYNLHNNTLPFQDDSMDYILIIAVLHHIPSHDIVEYIQEFKRILKPNGSIVVMEPCFHAKNPLSNFFMNQFDKGKYIREEESYLQFFHDQGLECQVIERFRKCFLYNELFFCANFIP